MTSYNIDRFRLPDEEDEPVKNCSECGRGIYEEEYYYDIFGEVWCDECIKELRHLA